MTTRIDVERKVAEVIRSVSEKLNIPEPDTASIVKDALLRSDAFLRARRPVIAVTGVTHTGKSSLVNALFEQKMLTEGLTSDTTKIIMQVKFESGMILYDTPGGGGTETSLENVTRAFLGARQLEKDVWDEPLSPVTQIPVADANTYNPQTGQPVVLRSIVDSNDVDLVLFVVSVEAGLKGDDVRFFIDVASRNRNTIVVINKVDLAGEQKVAANLELIKRKLDRQAIPVSAQTGAGLEALAVAIQHALPIECSKVLGETVDSGYKRIIRHRSIDIDSIIASVKSVQLISKSNTITDFTEYASNILGLYSVIVAQFAVSEQQLTKAGIDVVSIWNNIEKRMKDAKSTTNTVTPLIAVGLAFGAAVATAVTGGAAAIPIAIGLASGGSIGATTGIISGLMRKSQTFDQAIAREFNKLGSITSVNTRFECAASVVAFGRALRDCCDIIERRSKEGSFSQLFDKELIRAQDELTPFKDRIAVIDSTNDQRLVREIAASIVK